MDGASRNNWYEVLLNAISKLKSGSQGSLSRGPVKHLDSVAVTKSGERTRTASIILKGDPAALLNSTWGSDQDDDKGSKKRAVRVTLS